MPTIYDCRWDDCLWLSLFWKYWLTCSELPNDEPGLVTHILKHFSWTPYNAMSRKFGMWMMMIWTKNLKQILDTFLALAKFYLQIWTTNPGANLRSGRSDARPPVVQKKEKFLKKIGYFWSSVHSNTFFSAKVLVQNTAKELCKRLLDSLGTGTDIQT